MQLRCFEACKSWLDNTIVSSKKRFQPELSRKELNVVPEGFDKTDSAAKYLKMVGLGCRKNLPDALLLEGDVIGQFINIFRSASPLARYFE